MLDDSSIDDDYVRLQLAQGKTYAEVAREGFRGIGPPSIQSFAKTIGATRSKGDGQKRGDMVLEYEDRRLEDNWEYIGLLYDAVRPADVVEIRWRYLRRTL